MSLVHRRRGISGLHPGAPSSPDLEELLDTEQMRFRFRRDPGLHADAVLARGPRERWEGDALYL